MPRSEARIFASIWDDEDCLSLSVSARHMYYVVLLTQPDLSHCGVIPLREARWAKKSRQSLDEVCAALKELEAVGWTVTDHETRELFARSLVRRDKILRQPKMWLPLTASIGQIDSVHIRAALLCELVRTRGEGEVNKAILDPLDDLLRHMECQLDTLSGRHPGTNSDRQPDTQAGTDAGSHPDSPQGIGARNGSSTTRAPIPLPLTPSPVPDAGSPPPESLAADPAGATAEEVDLDSLIAEVREIRPDWASASIRRALADERVAERPAGLVRSAVLAVARDPASEHPGRLTGDGPWWRSRTALAPAPKPDWCRECDEQTRLTITDPPGRCPACHPLKEAS